MVASSRPANRRRPARLVPRADPTGSGRVARRRRGRVAGAGRRSRDRPPHRADVLASRRTVQGSGDGGGGGRRTLYESAPSVISIARSAARSVKVWVVRPVGQVTGSLAAA